MAKGWPVTQGSSSALEGIFWVRPPKGSSVKGPSDRGQHILGASFKESEGSHEANYFYGSSAPARARPHA